MKVNFLPVGWQERSTVCHVTLNVLESHLSYHASEHKLGILPARVGKRISSSLADIFLCVLVTRMGASAGASLDGLGSAHEAPGQSCAGSCVLRPLLDTGPIGAGAHTRFWPLLPDPRPPGSSDCGGLFPVTPALAWACPKVWACHRPSELTILAHGSALQAPVSLCLTLPSLPSQLEEKARLEAEARARGHLHLREERRRAEDERLTEELRRLQELQTLRAVKKKKKDRLAKDCPKLDMLASSFQAAAESAPGTETIHNGSLEPTEDPETSSPCPSRHADHAGPGPGADPSRHADPTEPVDAREAKRLLPKGIGGEQPEPLSFLLDMVHHHKGGAGPQKPRPGSKAAGEPARKPVEPPRAPEGPARPRPQAEPKARVLELPPLAGHRREETKVNSNNNNRKHLNHVREEKPGPGPAEPSAPSEPLQSGGKPVPAESPQPKGRGRKSKKKKGERASSSIGECRGSPPSPPAAQPAGTCWLLPQGRWALSPRLVVVR